MGPEWLTGIRAKVPRLWAILLGLVPIVAVLVLWWALTRGEYEERHLPRTIVPSPQEVVAKIGPLFTRKDLINNTFISLQRVCLGYLLAVSLVLPLGILMGSLSSVRAIFAPSTTASGYIPIASLVPLTIAWFHIGETQKIAFLTLAFAIYLLPAVVAAIDGVPDVYLRTAYTLGASRFQIIWRVLIPVALPEIWRGLRLAFGVGWTYLVLAEVVGRQGGLGAIIKSAEDRGAEMEFVYLVIALITLIAWLADQLLSYLGGLLFPYRRPG